MKTDLAIFGTLFNGSVCLVIIALEYSYRMYKKMKIKGWRSDLLWFIGPAFVLFSSFLTSIFFGLSVQYGVDYATEFLSRYFR